MAGAAPRDFAKEHIFLSKLLNVCLEPPTADLQDFVAGLKAKGDVRLRTELVSDVLEAKLSARHLVAERLKYCLECWNRCRDVRNDSHKYAQSLIEQLPGVQKMIVDYAALSFATAEMFNLDPVPDDQAAAVLKALVEKRELPTAFLVRLAEAEAVEDRVASLFGPLLAEVCQRLRGRNLAQPKSEDVGLLAAICSRDRGQDGSVLGSPALQKLLVTLPVFRPPQQALAFPQPGAQQPTRGIHLQTESLLGWLLAPTSIDTALYKDQSARQTHFQSLPAFPTQLGSRMELLTSAIISEVQDPTKKILDALLRSGPAAQEQVLLWFGALITGSEARTKEANILGQGHPARFLQQLNSPMYTVDLMLQHQMMQAQMTGFATPGLALNVTWSLMRLLLPIKKPEQIAGLDPYYILREGDPHAGILGGFASEARFGDSEEVDAAKSAVRAQGLLSSEPKFTTQVFWLALRSMHVLLAPALQESFGMAAGAGHASDLSKRQGALSELVLQQAVLQSADFLSGLAHVLNVAISFCLSAAHPGRAAEFAEGKVTSSVLVDNVSTQWSVLPACILDDVIDILDYYKKVKPITQTPCKLFSQLKLDMVVFLVTFILGAGNHIKNPSLRGKAVGILVALVKEREHALLLETSPVLAQDIVPGCIRVFTAVEKTKQSYYDIRMQLKYELRIPIMELMALVLPLEAHKKSLKTFASEHSDEFMKFLNVMMNDATMQISEGLDTLQEIRRLVREGGDAALSRPAGSEVAQDEQNAEGADVYAQSRSDPKAHCKQYMQMGHRTIRTLWSICGEAPSVIVSKGNVLQQLLHNCLNALLDRLVGPRCLELKGRVNDFNEYEFDPIELLKMTAEMYVFVSRADKDRVQKMITEDGRSYKPKTFQRASQILKREKMIKADMLKEFDAFVQQLNDLAASQEAALANITIPDNFLDPIMSEIMEDPVLLPTSNNIMDRKVIERHIMSNDDDPFNRLPLSVDQLVPQESLRKEIQEFCARHGLVAGGGAD